MPRVRPDQAAYLRTRRVVAFANGMCFECCKRPRVEGRRRCAECLRRNVERQAAIVAAGGCRGICGRPRPPGRSRCDECRAKHREYMAKRRLAAGKAAPVPRKPRAPRIVSSTSAGPSTLPATPAPTAPHPAEVDLSQRRAVIAALMARRAA